MGKLTVFVTGAFVAMALAPQFALAQTAPETPATATIRLPGLPDGTETAAPARLAPESIAVDPKLVNWCLSLLESRGPAQRPAQDNSSNFEHADCAFYFMALDRLAVLQPAVADPSDGAEGRPGRAGGTR